ncbi:bifunctional folylpolyglutamate synthase/dihydrofolate synthase [Paraliobacillus salinarum]|uniref:bifunctional folylpolyglutamate synthase/dihydrofolate synthase n=1 Tax=Paraliobacillus salinarum TaxID=1158996 RepID=UPI0015F724A2|nr:Mur ligase family protein [Paraliobacillus salinarum]
MIQSIQQVNEFLDKREKIGVKPGLQRVERLLKICNHPENSLKTIHIAGTNGKGSTLAFMESALRQANYTVGTFTSPSLTTRNAMIQLDGKAISDESFVRYFLLLLEEIERLDFEGDPPSPFEIIVVISLNFLSDHADIALIETGMGGKDDATNVVKPILSIITTIGKDHQHFLGNTYEEIASHKAGIIKDKTPVIVGDLPAETISVIQTIAKEKDAQLFRLGVDFFNELENSKKTFHFINANHRFPVSLGTRGVYQIHNATLAVQALLLLNESSLSLSNHSILTGIAETNISGRFEQVLDQPIVIVDSAHNAEGIEQFVRSVKAYYPTEKKQLIMAVFKDKPIKQMIQQVDPVFDRIIFTSFDHLRAAQAIDLYHFSKNENKQIIEDYQEVLSALKDQTMLTCITGSLDFVGKVRKIMQGNN